jgi:predicted dithiol-disulfide oxidoreductase (DUF899 family)
LVVKMAAVLRPDRAIVHLDRRLQEQLRQPSNARGIDMMNTAYHYLDLVPKGRDEAALDLTMSWVRYHDKY